MRELTMGEIKSTLDLVLERTKHLSQTSEEKQARTQKEIENRLNGMLQKYQDGVLSLEQLQQDYQALKTEFKLPDHTTLAGQVVNRLDPGVDNRALFDVLQHCCALDSSGLADVINEYQAGHHAAAQSRMEILKAGLAQEYFISGSAVVPNLEKDERWQLEAQAMLSAVKEELNQEKVKMVGS
jgi:hypothetical protein